MTQDEKWQQHYERLRTFMTENKRRPSKYKPDEVRMHDWFKHTRRLIARGGYPSERTEKFATLVEMAEMYRRKNQFDRDYTDDL